MPHIQSRSKVLEQEFFTWNLAEVKLWIVEMGRVGLNNGKWISSELYMPTESAMGKKANVYSVAFKMCEAQVIV